MQHHIMLQQHAWAGQHGVDHCSYLERGQALCLHVQPFINPLMGIDLCPAWASRAYEVRCTCRLAAAPLIYRFQYS